MLDINEVSNDELLAFVQTFAWAMAAGAAIAFAAHSKEVHSSRRKK